MRNALLVALLIGCGTSTSSHHVPPAPPASLADLQMNDLSILLPLPLSAADQAAEITPATAGRGGVMLPAALIDDNGAVVDPSGLVAVAVRLDPCFGQLGPITATTTCTNQLRIVFEQTDVVAGAVLDAAVHAFYQLTRDELIAVAGDIIAAREDSGVEDDLGPLAVHPIVADEGLRGPFAQKLFATVTKYAGQANLTRFTTLVLQMGSTGSGSQPNSVGASWELDGFDVAAGAATPLMIPTLMAGDTSESLEIEMPSLQTTPLPMTASSDNMFLLANLAQATTATPAAQQAALDAALRIENPGDHSPNTIDCASCHMTTPARQLVVDQLGLAVAGNPNAFVPDPSIPAANLAQTTQAAESTGGTVNIHAFSYVGTQPMINQRAINETAANLAYMRTL